MSGTDPFTRASLLVAAIVLVAGAGRASAQGEFSTRYDADGTLTIVNRISGRAATIPGADSVGRRPDAVFASNGSSPYDDLIIEHARANHLRPDLVRAVVNVESAFNPRARSPRGALGLMQLMPATARQFNVRNPFDPAENIRAGSSYLRQLLDRYDGNEALALAAYNAGPGAVDKYGQSVPPFRETQHYVDRVSEIAGPEDARPVTSTAATKFYRLVEIIDGREVVTYSTERP